MRRHALATLGSTLALMLCAAPVATAQAPAVGAPIAWAECADAPGLQCAQVRVPLDWDEPAGPTIELAVIRHLASDPARRIGSLFVNPGGPGDTGLGLLKGPGAADGIDQWGGGRFDVISWDPRGTNASSPVRCFTDAASERSFWNGAAVPVTRDASIRFRRKTADLARRCGKVSGRLLPHISTADTARDLDHLRALAGESKLTYVGLSYGTFLGQTYANMFPSRVRAMVLDGVVDPVAYSKDAETRIAVGAAAADEVYGKFLSLCRRAGSRCALAGGSRSPAQTFEGLLARVKRSAIPAPGAKPPGTLDYADLLASQFAPLRNPDLWPQNAKDLAAAARGDGSALETMARPYRTPAGWAGSLTSAAVSCADAGARLGSRQWPQAISSFERSSRLQGRLLGWWLWAPCASWPAKGEDAYRGPWNRMTPNPILLIGTRYDPNTSYANAQRSERLLGNAVLLTHDGYGHISFTDPSACVDAARTAYLVSLVTPAKGTVCRSDKQPFAPPAPRR